MVMVEIMYKQMKRKNEETMVIFNRYDEFDLQLPAIISVEWYKEESLRRNLEISIVSHFKTELLRESQVSSGKSLQIFNQEVAGTEVKLNIDGEIKGTSPFKLEIIPQALEIFI